MKIHTRYNKIQAQISKNYEKLTALQTECTHPNLDKKHCSNTGNYDPTVDSYWIEYNCPDCGKRWNVYQ